MNWLPVLCSVLFFGTVVLFFGSLFYLSLDWTKKKPNQK